MAVVGPALARCSRRQLDADQRFSPRTIVACGQSQLGAASELVVQALAAVGQAHAVDGTAETPCPAVLGHEMSGRIAEIAR